MKLLNSVMMMMMKEVIVMMMIAKRRKRLTDMLNVVEVVMMMTVKMMNVVTTHTVNFMTTPDLVITLRDGVLHDERHATGEIVANHQFHSINHHKRMPYTKGFSIVYTEGNYYLALDHKIKFWHCKVDDNGLYKIYDKSIGEQCSEIELIILKSDKKLNLNSVTTKVVIVMIAKRKKKHGKNTVSKWSNKLMKLRAIIMVSVLLVSDS